MSVQELIDKLQEIEDKSLLVIDSANDLIDTVQVETVQDSTYVRIF